MTSVDVYVHAVMGAV